MPKPDRRKKTDAAKILIVDDHPVVRDGLTVHIATQQDLVVCGEAEDLAEAAALVETLQPDVAIVDISLKTGNGIELIQRIRANNDKVRILVWSMYPESLYAERALRAGAQGYLHKSQATRELLGAIRSVLAGKLYFSVELTDNLLNQAVGRKALDRSPMERLSAREMEAFELIGQGMTTAQIARRMHISPKTLATYRSRIKEKLNLANVNELIQRATRWMIEMS